MKNKLIACLLLCMIAMTSMSISAMAADTTAPTATSFNVYSVSATGSLLSIPTNNESESWTKYSTVQARLNGVSDTSGVNGVVFRVTYWNYPNSYSTTLVTGQMIGTSSSWKANIPVNGNSVTIQAFPVDSLGNTQITTMGGDTSYQYTKVICGDSNVPTAYTSFDSNGNHYYDVNSRYITNSLQVKIKITAEDNSGAPWISSNLKSVGVRIYKNGNSSYITYPATYVGDNSISRCGYYEYTFSQAFDEAAENSYKAVAVATDYAGNTTYGEEKYFVIDRLRPNGTVEVSSNTVVGDSFDVYLSNVTEATYVDRIQFPTWTTANGQDDLIWYDGYRVGENQWKITINRANHNNEKGEYIIHTYSTDALGNFGIVGATSVLLQ